MDSAGNVYVADTYNSTIREITPLGQVTTLAGMAGVNGTRTDRAPMRSFISPTAWRWTARGNVYVADTDNSTIREDHPGGAGDDGGGGGRQPWQRGRDGDRGAL